MPIFLFTHILVIQFFASNLSLVRRPAAKVYEIPQLAFRHDRKATESTCTVKIMILATKTLISGLIFVFLEIGSRRLVPSPQMNKSLQINFSIYVNYKCHTKSQNDHMIKKNMD